MSYFARRDVAQKVSKKIFEKKVRESSILSDLQDNSLILKPLLAQKINMLLEAEDSILRDFLIKSSFGSTGTHITITINFMFSDFVPTDSSEEELTS